MEAWRAELYHHGIKGMKWGVRRTPKQLGHKKPTAKKSVAVNLAKRVVIVAGSLAFGALLTKAAYSSVGQKAVANVLDVIGKKTVSEVVKSTEEGSGIFDKKTGRELTRDEAEALFKRFGI